MGGTDQKLDWVLVWITGVDGRASARDDDFEKEVECAQAILSYLSSILVSLIPRIG